MVSGHLFPATVPFHFILAEGIPDEDNPTHVYSELPPSISVQPRVLDPVGRIYGQPHVEYSISAFVTYSRSDLTRRVVSATNGLIHVGALSRLAPPVYSYMDPTIARFRDRSIVSTRGMTWRPFDIAAALEGKQKLRCTNSGLEYQMAKYVDLHFAAASMARSNLSVKATVYVTTHLITETICTLRPYIHQSQADMVRHGACNRIRRHLDTQILRNEYLGNTDGAAPDGCHLRTLLPDSVAFLVLEPFTSTIALRRLALSVKIHVRLGYWRSKTILLESPVELFHDKFSLDGSFGGFSWQTQQSTSPNAFEVCLVAHKALREHEGTDLIQAPPVYSP